MQEVRGDGQKRIVKAEGCEASWHMTAKPSGTQPTVNAALVHRQFAHLPGGELHRVRCVLKVTGPDRTTPGYQGPGAAASCPLHAKNWQQSSPTAQRDAR